MHQSEETEAGQWSETSAGEQINQSHVNSGFCLAVNELKILYLTIQPSDERDNIVRFQLSLTVTESGFPKDCQVSFLVVSEDSIGLSDSNSGYHIAQKVPPRSSSGQF